MEDKGVILRAGKYADMVVLDQNIFEIDPQELSDVKLQATMMGGKVTHREGI